MIAPIPANQRKKPFSFPATTPASNLLKPEDFKTFRLHRRYRCFVNHTYQYTDCELADLITVADRQYRVPSRKEAYKAVVRSISAERKLRPFDTPLHRQLRFLLACRNSEQNLFIKAKVARFGSRHAPQTPNFKDYVDHIPDVGLGLMDFFKSMHEFHQLEFYKRDTGYHVSSAGDTELLALEKELLEWLSKNSEPKRYAYRARVLTQVQAEIQRRAASEEPEFRFVRLIQRGASNYSRLERAGWNIAEIFAQRGRNRQKR